MQRLANSSYQYRLELILSILIGAFVGAFLVYAFGRLSSKWAYFLVGVIAATSGLFVYKAISKGLSQLLLLTAVVTLPIHYDINFFYQMNVPFLVDANGISVSIFDILFIPLFLQWISKGFFGEEAEFKFDKRWAVPLAVIFVLHFFSAALSPFPFFSFSMFIWLIKSYCIFYYLLNNIRDHELLRRIGHAFAISLFIEAVVVIEQKFVGVIFTAEALGKDISITSLIGLERVVRLAGTLSHPNQLAMFINLLLPACIFFTLNETQKHWKIFLVVTVALSIIIELWTASRGGWVGLVTAMVLTTYLLLMKKGYNLVKVTVATVFIGAFTFVTLFAASSTFRNRLSGEDYGTAELRYPLMAVAKNMIMHNPYTGVGLNIYTARMKEYDNTPEYVSKYYPHPVHNTYYLVAAETGIPSLLAVLIFLATAMIRAFWVFWRGSGNVEVMALGILGGLISWSMHNIVNMDHIFINYTIWVLFGLVAAMELMLQAEKNKSKLLDSTSFR